MWAVAVTEAPVSVTSVAPKKPTGTEFTLPCSPLPPIFLSLTNSGDYAVCLLSLTLKPQQVPLWNSQETL